MSVTVFNHLHDPPLLVAGADAQQLIIQTGTIVFDYTGPAQSDWVRDQLVHPVFDLTPHLGGFFEPPAVRATASAAPSSMSYSPPATAGNIDGAGLVAQGDVVLGGIAPPDGGGLQVSGQVTLPIVGAGSGFVLPIPAAGWAIDRTRTARSGSQIELMVDVAIFGPSSLRRLERVVG